MGERKQGDRRGPKHERGAIWDWKEGEKCATYAAKGKNEGKDGKEKKGSEGRREEILQFLKKISILIKKSKE